MEVMQSLSYPRDLRKPSNNARSLLLGFHVRAPLDCRTSSVRPRMDSERGDAVETHLVASLPNFYKWKDPRSTAAIFGRQVWCRQHH